MSTFLKTLGPVEVWVDGRLVPLPSRQLRTLLAALILSPHRRLTAERLIELIWDQEPAPTAPAQLHVLVSRLRRCLTDGADCGPRLQHRGGYYELDLAGSTADLDIYLAAVEECRTARADGRADQADAALGRALEQWRGQPTSTTRRGIGWPRSSASTRGRNWGGRRYSPSGSAVRRRPSPTAPARC